MYKCALALIYSLGSFCYVQQIHDRFYSLLFFLTKSDIDSRLSFLSLLFFLYVVILYSLLPYLITLNYKNRELYFFYFGYKSDIVFHFIQFFFIYDWRWYHQVFLYLKSLYRFFLFFPVTVQSCYGSIFPYSSAFHNESNRKKNVGKNNINFTLLKKDQTHYVGSFFLKIK